MKIESGSAIRVARCFMHLSSSLLSVSNRMNSECGLLIARQAEVVWIDDRQSKPFHPRASTQDQIQPAPQSFGRSLTGYVATFCSCPEFDSAEELFGSVQLKSGIPVPGRPNA